MKKFVAAAFIALFFANIASAQGLSEDCDCGHNPYVDYKLNVELELDENPWRVTRVTPVNRTEEGEVCEVYLELIPHTEQILYQDIKEVPEYDQEIFWNDEWVLMSEFETQMDASSCDIAGTQS